MVRRSSTTESNRDWCYNDIHVTTAQTRMLIIIESRSIITLTYIT